MHRCGYITVVGRPNVGKSTLVNGIVGQKLSIISRKPQTTRHRILGIKSRDDAQLLLVDTPGIHDTQHRALNRAMNRAASGALNDVDVIVFVVEALRFGRDDELVVERLKEAGTDAPLVVVVNKVDTVADKSRLLPFLEMLGNRVDARELVPLCARRPGDLERLEAVLVPLLPEGEAVYPADQFTDRSARFMAMETVREKLIRQLGDELPHRLAVEIEYFEEGRRAIDAGAVIWVEKQSQKAIVVGKQGSRLKRVGTQARADLEQLLGKHLRLSLWVKVRADWTNNPRAVDDLGLAEFESGAPERLR